MNIEDVQHLAKLSRIRLSDEELSSFAKDFDGILEYVAMVQKISADASGERTTAVVNAFRADEETHAPSEFTERLVSAAPEREKNYVKVKKILGES